MASKKRDASTETETNAMAVCGGVFDALSNADSRRRVLDWLYDRYGVGGVKATPRDGAQTESARANVVKTTAAAASERYDSFAELHDAAQPKNEKDHALVAGYWQQLCSDPPRKDFTAAAANADLKNVGHAIQNITVPLNRLKAQKPALVVQMSKSGTAKQARKTYKVTTAGERRVQAMIRGEVDQGDEA